MALDEIHKTTLEEMGYKNYLRELDSLSSIKLNFFITYQEELRKARKPEFIVEFLTLKALDDDYFNTLDIRIRALSQLSLKVQGIFCILESKDGIKKLSVLHTLLYSVIPLPFFTEIEWLWLLTSDDGLTRIELVIKHAEHFQKEAWTRDDLGAFLKACIDFTNMKHVKNTIQEIQAKRMLTNNGYEQWLQELMALAPETRNYFIANEGVLRNENVPQKMIVDIVLQKENGEQNFRAAIQYLNHIYRINYLTPKEYASTAASKCGSEKVYALVHCLPALKVYGFTTAEVLEIESPVVLWELQDYYIKAKKLRCKPLDLKKIVTLDDAVLRVSEAKKLLSLGGIKKTKSTDLLEILATKNVWDIPNKIALYVSPISTRPPLKRPRLSDEPYGFFSMPCYDESEKETLYRSAILGRAINTM